MSRRSFRIAVIATVLMSGCGPKAAPPVDPKVSPRQVAYEQKVRSILQLEDERQLRSSVGDLIALLADPEARVRRRAALAVGQIGRASCRERAEMAEVAV